MIEFLRHYRIEIVAVTASLGLMFLVFELVRRNHVKEKYSFLWFLSCLSVMALSFRRDWLETFSRAIGIYYPPSALFIVFSFFVTIILVHFSIVVSKLLYQNQKLAQKIALLEAQVLEHQKDQHSEDGHDHAA
jgi:hypothetical protein